MGGMGSGRSGGRPTIESCPFGLDIHDLRRSGCLVPDATCKGQMDEWAHEPVRLVQKYLDDLAKDPATSFLQLTASFRWKNSPEFEQYQSQAKDLVLSTNLGSGPAGCLEVVKVVRSSRTELQASGCFIELRDKLADLHFRVVQKAGTKRWEIDEIRIE